jgi:hypothetical protein
MAFPFVPGDRVRHHIYGKGVILSLGYKCATVRFLNGIHSTVTSENLTVDN